MFSNSTLGTGAITTFSSERSRARIRVDSVAASMGFNVTGDGGRPRGELDRPELHVEVRDFRPLALLGPGLCESTTATTSAGISGARQRVRLGVGKGWKF